MSDWKAEEHNRALQQCRDLADSGIIGGVPLDALEIIIRNVAALTADKERLQRQLDAAGNIRSTILKIVRHGLSGDISALVNNARFIAEQIDDKRFTESMEKTISGDWLVVTPAASTLEAIEQENK